MLSFLPRPDNPGADFLMLTDNELLAILNWMLARLWLSSVLFILDSC